MQVAKITHWRCDDYSATTYVWVPDDLSWEAFSTIVRQAKQDYQKLVDEWHGLEKIENPGFQPNYKAFPHKTVAEIDAEFKIAKEKYDEWHKEHLKGYTDFGEFLRQYGFVPFWDISPDLSADIHWGHQHGKNINYEDTFPSYEDADNRADNPKGDLKGPAYQDEQAGLTGTL